MTRFWKTLNLIVLGLLILICGLGTFYKHISFGLGLGDIFGYLILYIGTVAHFILTLISRNKGATRYIVMTFVFLIFTLLTSLYATLWRGHEYPWNGSIFYLPCPTEIEVRNSDCGKKLLIQMCSMDYYSEFIGTWDGKYLKIDAGEVKVPNDLEKFIKRPIDKVEIESDYYEKIENDNLIKEFYFDTDTLKSNREYKLAGEITAILNSRPVMKVKIK